jgi:hypothetical protein
MPAQSQQNPRGARADTINVASHKTAPYVPVLGRSQQLGISTNSNDPAGEDAAAVDKERLRRRVRDIVNQRLKDRGVYTEGGESPSS